MINSPSPTRGRQRLLQKTLSRMGEADARTPQLPFSWKPAGSTMAWLLRSPHNLAESWALGRVSTTAEPDGERTRNLREATPPSFSVVDDHTPRPANLRGFRDSPRNQHTLTDLVAGKQSFEPSHDTGLATPGQRPTKLLHFQSENSAPQIHR